MEKENQWLYKALITFVNNSMEFLRNNDYNPSIEAFLWMQGESDSSKSHAKQYYNNLSEYVKNIREDLVNMEFIDAGISDSKHWKEYQTRNNAKKKFSEKVKITIISILLKKAYM